VHSISMKSELTGSTTGHSSSGCRLCETDPMLDTSTHSRCAVYIFPSFILVFHSLVRSVDRVSASVLHSVLLVGGCQKYVYVVCCGCKHANNVNRQISLCGPNQTLESGVDSLGNGFCDK